MLTPVRVLSDNGPMRVELARWRDQLVVVKRLRGMSTVMEARLQREAAVVRKLEHPNIVPLIANRDGALIYEYCPGVSLAEALTAGALSVARSLKVVRDVLDALAYAHARGVIHCDVKPDNILIKGERALLTDFGFAKDIHLTAITTRDMLLGTPNYMAPEQFRGVRTEPRSDLYAVGAVLYHMLGGAPPYGGQVIRFLAGDDTVALDPLPDHAAALAPTILTALRRDPEERHPDARTMAEALGASLVGNGAA